MANRTTHRRILTAPEPEPAMDPTLILKRQTRPSTSLDPTMPSKPSSRLNPNHRVRTSQGPITQNPLPSLIHTANVEKQSKDKLPKKPNRELDKNKVEEVVVKMELMGLKGEEHEQDYESRRLSSSSSSASLGGRRKSFCGSAQVQLNRLADVFASNGVKVVSVDMPPFMQIHAVECARKTCDSLEKFTSKTLALTLKKEFDGVYGPAWHCIVGTSFGSFVTHSIHSPSELDGSSSLRGLKINSAFVQKCFGRHEEPKEGYLVHLGNLDFCLVQTHIMAETTPSFKIKHDGQQQLCITTFQVVVGRGRRHIKTLHSTIVEVETPGSCSVRLGLSFTPDCDDNEPTEEEERVTTESMPEKVQQWIRGDDKGEETIAPEEN